MDFIDALIKRRSLYELKKEISISDEELIDLIKSIVKHIPSSYNAQSQRAVLLLGGKHDLFWEITKAELKKIVPEKRFPKTEKKINGFKAGYGTILYFDEGKTTQNLVDKFPLYKENFIRWADQQNGMLQVSVWTALAARNIGASLQHYNEVIEKRIKKEFKIAEHWNLIAQMPFGNIIGVPREKAFVDIDERFIVMK